MLNKLKSAKKMELVCFIIAMVSTFFNIFMICMAVGNNIIINAAAMIFASIIVSNIGYFVYTGALTSFLEKFRYADTDLKEDIEKATGFEKMELINICQNTHHDMDAIHFRHQFLCVALIICRTFESFLYAYYVIRDWVNSWGGEQEPSILAVAVIVAAVPMAELTFNQVYRKTWDDIDEEIDTASKPLSKLMDYILTIL